jgi:hypothetical protein
VPVHTDEEDNIVGAVMENGQCVDGTTFALTETEITYERCS